MAIILLQYFYGAWLGGGHPIPVAAWNPTQRDRRALIAFGPRGYNMGRPPPPSLTVSLDPFTPLSPSTPPPTAIDDHPPPLRRGRVGVSERVRERARRSCRLTAGRPTETADCSASSGQRRPSHAHAHTRARAYDHR